MSSQSFGPAHLPIFDPSPTRGVTKIRAPGGTEIMTAEFAYAGELPSGDFTYYYSPYWTPPVDITMVAVDLICGVCPSYLTVKLYVDTTPVLNFTPYNQGGTPGSFFLYRSPYFNSFQTAVGVNEGQTLRIELYSGFGTWTYAGSDLTILVHYVMGTGPVYGGE